MRRVIRYLAHLAIIAGLLVLTQVGAFAYVLALGLAHALRRHRTAEIAALVIVIYGALTYVAVPAIAPMFGRERLPCATSPVLGCLLNRTYTRPEVAELIRALDAHMGRSFPSSGVTVLDAGFPFFDGFPLLPHKSHNNGRKVDLAFFYRDAESGVAIPSGAPSPLGYFRFERPSGGGLQPCASSLLRWDFAWAQPDEPEWTLDEERTRAMILWLKQQPHVTKILLEPHLAERLNVGGGKVRFQGCFAARHDDHLHVEVR